MEFSLLLMTWTRLTHLKNTKRQQITHARVPAYQGRAPHFLRQAGKKFFFRRIITVGRPEPSFGHDVAAAPLQIDPLARVHRSCTTNVGRWEYQYRYRTTTVCDCSGGGGSSGCVVLIICTQEKVENPNRRDGSETGDRERFKNNKQ